MKLILASTSPYRAQLLSRLRIPFAVHPSEIDESVWQKTIRCPDDLATALAFQKASHVAHSFPDDIVIGADQVVDLNGTALGKPGTADAAVKQLLMMSGQCHRLLTAVTLRVRDQQIDILDETRLHMRHITAAEASRYVALDQPWDCAGSYKIECAGISLFERIECEDFTSIMGLPLLRLSQQLRKLGFEIP